MRDKIIEGYNKSIVLHKIIVTRTKKRLAYYKEILTADEQGEIDLQITEEENLIKDLEQQLNYIKEHLE